MAGIRDALSGVLSGADVVGTACLGSYNTVLGRRCSTGGVLGDKGFQKTVKPTRVN